MLKFDFPRKSVEGRKKNVFAFSVHIRYSHQVFTLIMHTYNSHLTTHSVKVKAEKESSVHSVPPAVHVPETPHSEESGSLRPSHYLFLEGRKLPYDPLEGRK